MRSLLFVTLIVVSLAVGCGGSSGKRVDSSAGDTGGSISSGAGGASAAGTGGATTLGTGGAEAPRSDASADGNSDALVVSGTCPQAAAAPCGGNLVGAWTLKLDGCALSSSSTAFCPGLTFSVAPTSNYGIAYTFNANGTLNASIAGSFAATIRYPPECLYSDAGAAESCTDLSNRLQTIAQQVADAGTDNIKTASYSCSPDPSGICVCNEDVAYTPRTLTGTYATSGTKITITALSGPGLPDAGPLDGGGAEPTDYCVSGNTLTLWPSSSSSSTKPAVLTR